MNIKEYCLKYLGNLNYFNFVYFIKLKYNSILEK